MIKALIFDLDGTLLNTIDDITFALNQALAAEGLAPYTSHEVKAFVGSGVSIMVDRALKEHSHDHELSTRVRQRYMEIYHDHQADLTSPYPGTISLLDELKRHGYRLGLLSNKPHEDTLRVVDHYFGLYRFDAVLGQREGVPIKPDPTGLFELLELLGVTQAECLFVGDSDVDMETATRAQITKIGVLWGFRDRGVLESQGADFIIDDPLNVLNIALKAN